MNILDDLIISCRTTCGCGSGLVPYTKQTETTHYLLTCKPYSERYDHPLLIAIDKKSPIFEKARKWEKSADIINSNTGQSFKEWYEQSEKDRQIVKRLEERIKELKKHRKRLQYQGEMANDFDEQQEYAISDLQKILEMKK